MDKKLEKVRRFYRVRNAYVRRGGFDSYAEFLKSDEWKQQRSVVMRRDRGKCQGCGGPATEVHHLRYTKKTMLRGATYWLIAVCRECHQFLEFDPQTGEKRKSTSRAPIFTLREKHGLTKSTSKFIQNGEAKRAKSKAYMERRRLLSPGTGTDAS